MSRMAVSQRPNGAGFIPAVDTGIREPKERFLGPSVPMICWSHEARVSTEDVVVDMNLIPNAKEGDVAELRVVESGKKMRLYFIVKQISEEVSKRMLNVQVSVATGNLLTLLDLPPRSKVLVKLREKLDVEADLVEIHFKDIYLTRADMWRIASKFIGKCFYTSQRINYCDSVRCSINTIYRNGKKVFSGYVSPRTKFVYRSESVRTIFFIQMSSEMWHFEENGEVMFHKLVNSFLPEVFRRWREEGVHHVVTIVLFTSVDVSERKSRLLEHGERHENTRDYYRVVVDQVHISQWSDIMAALRHEFMRFPKDVLQQPGGKIEGHLLPACKGNLMEAISLAMTMVSSKFVDRDLRQTNSQVIIVTPGSGIYDVDHDLFYRTSMKLLSIELSIDLVCLSRPPLHVTPLFRFKKKNKVVNCVPSWLDISFWKTTEHHSKHWIPRCKIYEIQMMGVMENELSAISIDYLPRPKNLKSLDRLMVDYDKGVFRRKDPARSSSENVEPILLKPRVSSTEAMNKADGSVSSFPASAILSSPAISSESRISTADMLSKTIAPKPKMSALSSLLSLGMKREPPKTPKPLSPVLKAATEPPTPQSELPHQDLAARLEHVKSLASLKTVKSTISLRQSEDGDSSSSRSTSAASNSISATPKNLEDTIQKPLAVRRTRTVPMRSASFQKSTSSPASIQTADLADNSYAWVTVANPSKSVFNTNSIQNISNYGRWKNVFPPNVKRRAVKWRSLKSPACLPLATEIFPSVEEFERNYTFQIYDVTPDADKEDDMSPGDLLAEMVAMRLTIGFQIVVGERVSQVEAQRRPGGNPALIVQSVPDDYHGIRIYMTRSNQIHRLACDLYGTINVQLYRKTNNDDDNLTRTYHPMVKTKYESNYTAALGNFFDPSVRNVNWNGLDQQLAGYDDVYETGTNGTMFRIRFALIPTPLSTSHPAFQEDLNQEEIRLEGLRQIILQLHKNNYQSSGERRRSAKDTKPPEVKFYTGDLGDYLVSLLDSYKNYVEEGFINTRKKLFVNETMNKNTITLSQLASEMQGDKGVRMTSRRWHWRMYNDCFVGQELVAWLLDNFTDIDSPEDAIEYGNLLMKKGLFHHVDNRHTFLDGHYFYQMNQEHIRHDREKEKHTGWFGKKLAHDGLTSSNSSAHKTAQRQSSITKEDYSATVQEQSRRNSGGQNGTSVLSEVSSKHNSTQASNHQDQISPSARELPKILISRSMKLDLDPDRKKSSRHEFLTVHVDRVHNPENAFHLRLEWVNATPKLIDDAIVNLSRIGDQFGLKLVQVPIDEISSLPNGNPFCSFIRTQLSVAVPDGADLILAQLKNPLTEDPFYYHKQILHRAGFVLDLVSSSSLMKKREVDILYSWGRPFYNYHQYIHKSGIVIAQMVADNGFILMANTLHISRAAISEAQLQLQQASSQAANQASQLGNHRQTQQSRQMSMQMPQLQQSDSRSSVADAEKIMFEFQQLCEDKDKLFMELSKIKQDWVEQNLDDNA